MPINNPGSGQSVSGSISVAENSHYISQKIIDADTEVTDAPIILVPPTEDKAARAYWIFNNSKSLATIQIGLAPGLILPLEPGMIYEQKDSGGIVNEVTLLSGKITGILKLADALPEPPEPEEPELLIFAPMANPNIATCSEGHSVFAVPATEITAPIYLSFLPDSWLTHEVFTINGYDLAEFTSSTIPLFSSDYYSASEGGALWQLTPAETVQYITILTHNMMGGTVNPVCASWVAETNSFQVLSESSWVN